MGWTVQGSNPGGERFSAPIQTGPGAHPVSCTVGTRSLSRDEAAGTWRWPPSLSVIEVKAPLDLHLYSLPGPSWPVVGRALPSPSPCYFVKFEGLTAVYVNIVAFWHITPCTEEPAVPIIRVDEYLIVEEAACYFETSVHATLHGFTSKKTAVFITLLLSALSAKNINQIQPCCM
jgi:hypothetical protein